MNSSTKVQRRTILYTVAYIDSENLSEKWTQDAHIYKIISSGTDLLLATFATRVYIIDCI